MKIVLATYNSHKKHEFEALFKGTGIEILSLSDLGCKEEIVEDGSTFVENAMIKARAIYNLYQLPTLADDSGICVDGLGGEPGIHSARFGGYDTPSAVKNRKIIGMLEGNPERGAHYTCALAYLDGEHEFVTEKQCHGVILEEEAGTGGFGYDPIFFLEEYGKTMAEIPLEEKNRISHRGRALAEFRRYMEETCSIA